MKSKIGNIFVLVSICAIVVYAETVPRRLQRSTGTCGVVKVSSGLIVKGQRYSRGNFPWVVALMYSKVSPPMFFCAGSVISSAFVISAAHCMNEKYSTETLLSRDVLGFFGAHDLMDPFESGRYSLSPKRIFVHDDWNPRTTEYDGDLSLLEFDEGSILHNDFVQPICLWNAENELTENEGTVCGWGRSEDQTKKHETKPKWIKVLIQSNDICLPGKPRLAGLASERTFCAGTRDGSGVCHGDSGGGLFIKVDGLYHLKGIVSSSLLSGDDCDVSSNAVYTNVPKFREWIDKITGGGLVTVIQAVRDVLCTFKMSSSNCCGNKARTCFVDQTIENEKYVIGSAFDSTVELFLIENNREAKFLPKHIGEKFPNVKEFYGSSCRLLVVRNYYFKDMRNLLMLSLGYNKIATIEPDSFKDLVRVKLLSLDNNRIATLDEGLFATMVSLEEIHLTSNEIKSLSPTTFKIAGAKLKSVYLKFNDCINGDYSREWGQLEADIRDKCTL